MVVNTCAFIEEARQESIDTVLALADRKGDRRRARRHRLHGRALRRRAGHRPARGRRGRRVRRAGHPRPQAGRLSAPFLRPPQPPPSRLAGAVGLREGGGGLRQGVRLLRHPRLPRAAALPVGDPGAGRGRVAGRRRRAGGRAGRPGPGQLRARPGRRHQGPRPAGGGGVGAGAVGAAPLPLPVRPHRPARRRGGRHRRALLRPVAPARVAARCCGACAGGATAIASSAASRRSGPARPPPPSAPTSSSATPARRRPTTTSSSRFVADAGLDWCGFFAYSREEGTYAADLDGAVARRPGGRSAGRAPRAAGRHHRRPSRRAGRGGPPPSSSTLPAWPAAIARRRRSTGSSPCPSTSPSGTLHEVRITGSEGPDSSAEPLVLATR